MMFARCSPMFGPSPPIGVPGAAHVPPRRIYLRPCSRYGNARSSQWTLGYGRRSVRWYVEHRLDPLFRRIDDEHREFLAHGAGIPIRRVPVDAGTVAICGDRDQLDRRGRHAVTYVRQDQRLVILDLVDEADEAEHCVQYQHADLAVLEPFTVLFRGKPREFVATSKSFLMGVCECGDATILVSGLDGGLAFNVCTPEGWTCVLEPRPNWVTPMDLDAELGGRRSRTSKPRTRARAVDEPSAQARARAREVEEHDDEVREHRARLHRGITTDPEALQIFEDCLIWLSQEAMLPHPCLKQDHKGSEHLNPVVTGLLYAVTRGCGNLGGLESAMRKKLRDDYGVVLPPGALSGAMRRFQLLGCPLVSQPEPAKGQKFVRRWLFEVDAALNEDNPKHLEFLRWARTRRHPPASVGPTDREGKHSDADDRRKGPTPESAQAPGPAAAARGAASEPDGEAGTGAEPSTRRTRSTVLPAQLETFMQFTFGVVILLASQVTILNQRVEAAELAAAQAVRARAETATAAEQHSEPAASVDADPPSGAGVVDTATGADQIDLNATTTADADERTGNQFATLPASGAVETAAAAAVQQPSPDELNANTSLRADDEHEEPAVDAATSAEPPADADAVSMATGADRRIDFDAVSAVDADEQPGRTGLHDVARASLHLDRWSFASSVSRAHADAQLLATASGWSASTAHTITWPAADLGAGAPIEGEVLPEHTDSPAPSVEGLHEANIAVPLRARMLDLDRWDFATVMFLVMFELEDPYLIRLVALKVIAWMAEAEERVELTCTTLWPRALHPAGARLGSAGLACAEQLNATQAWVPAQAELNAGPRGPPPLGC